jgi:carboxylesterase type B
MFVPSKVEENDITAVVKHYFGTYPFTASAIINRYSSIPDVKARIKALFQFSTFTCHNRFISEGFKGKTYNLQYSRGAGFHGSDIGADFFDKDAAFNLATLKDRTFGTFAVTFQSYLISHARTGDPNKLREEGALEWPIVTLGETLTGVLNATDRGFELISDQMTRGKDCDFWKDELARMTNSLGESTLCSWKTAYS